MNKVTGVLRQMTVTHHKLYDQGLSKKRLEDYGKHY